jgi:hypothetical protein
MLSETILKMKTARTQHSETLTDEKFVTLPSIKVDVKNNRRKHTTKTQLRNSDLELKKFESHPLNLTKSMILLIIYRREEA